MHTSPRKKAGADAPDSGRVVGGATVAAPVAKPTLAAPDAGAPASTHECDSGSKSGSNALVGGSGSGSGSGISDGDSTGLKDDQLMGGKMVYYSGSRKT